MRKKEFCNIVNETLVLRENKMILVVRKGMAEKVKDSFMISAMEVNSVDEIQINI